jgi:hypothetical protein
MTTRLAIRFTLLSAVLAALAMPVSGQMLSGVGGAKHAPTQTDSTKTVNGFSGMVLVTPDTDWRSKWETPSSTVPAFNTVTTIQKGTQIFILTLLGNPPMDDQGIAEVTCDMDIVRPDGTPALHEEDTPCLRGPVHTSPPQLYLAAHVLTFVGDPDDPTGKWTVRITLNDKVKKTVIPLKTSFILER